MMKKRSFMGKALVVCLITVLACSLLLVGCGASEKDAMNSDVPTEIKIGIVAPFTGPLASAAQTVKWVSDFAIEKINDEKGGVYLSEYDVTVPITIIYGDNETDSVKATEIATKMVLDDEVDMLIGAWTPATTIPVTGVAEKYGVPCVCSNSPFEVWNADGAELNWTYGIMFYFEKMYTTYADAFAKVEGTNKTVGFVLDTSPDGMGTAAILAPLLEDRGFTVVNPGHFPEGTNDYTNIIAELKAADVEILVGNMPNASFSALWKDCISAGFIPKAAAIGKAVHYEEEVLAIEEALGEGVGIGLMSECFWNRTYPYTSDLFEINCEDIALKFEADHGYQCPENMGYDTSFWDVLYASLTEAGSLDKEAIRDALGTISVNTLNGTLSADDNRVFEALPSTIQWQAGKGEWKYDPIVIASLAEGIEESDPIVLEISK